MEGREGGGGQDPPILGYEVFILGYLEVQQLSINQSGEETFLC